MKTKYLFFILSLVTVIASSTFFSTDDQGTYLLADKMITCYNLDTTLIDISIRDIM
ncbi:hypothetical protein [Bacillus chungangensis]|uniref:Uncharacterized protein n=1 Tax=Bacillus chungangensis TaxID=587633 RepID=A0ABT9WP85_9BACI|nr:hypothetical protein [Bacillus chungangensis]MDQ0174919.1 hypothetical protein [Bacillus chungangensis]